MRWPVHHPLLLVMLVLWVVVVVVVVLLVVGVVAGGSGSLGSLIARLQQGFPLKGGGCREAGGTGGSGGRGGGLRPLSVPDSISATAAVSDQTAPCCRR